MKLSSRSVFAAIGGDARRVQIPVDVIAVGDGRLRLERQRRGAAADCERPSADCRRRRALAPSGPPAHVKNSTRSRSGRASGGGNVESSHGWHERRPSATASDKLIAPPRREAAGVELPALAGRVGHPAADGDRPDAQRRRATSSGRVNDALISIRVSLTVGSRCRTRPASQSPQTTKAPGAVRRNLRARTRGWPRPSTPRRKSRRSIGQEHTPVRRRGNQPVLVKSSLRVCSPCGALIVELHAHFLPAGVETADFLRLERVASHVAGGLEFASFAPSHLGRGLGRASPAASVIVVGEPSSL